MSQPPTQPSTNARRANQRLQELGQRFTYRVAVLLRTAQIHSPENRAMDFSLRTAAQAANALFDMVGEVNLIGEEHIVHLNEQRLHLDKSASAPVADTMRALRDWQLGGIQLTATTDVETWRRFIIVLQQQPVIEAGGTPDPDAHHRVNLALGERSGVRVLPIMRLGGAGIGGAGGGAGQSLLVQASRALSLYVRAIELMIRLHGQDADKLGGAFPAGLTKVLQALVDQVFTEPRFVLALVAWKQGGPYLPRHVVNTLLLGLALGRRLGLNRSALMDLAQATVCADLGMVLVPEAIREKPGPLTAQERALIDRHPLDSARLTLTAGRLSLTARRRLRLAFEHHRKADQSGAPKTLGPLDQHLLTRIFAVCETFDALTTTTPWRAGLLPDEALAKLQEDAGRGLDPALVGQLQRLLGRWPLGATVLLSTGELAVVYLSPTDERAPDRPVVRVVAGPNGETSGVGALIDLTDRDARGGYQRSVRRAVDPAAFGVEVQRALFG
ncbi:MAG: hypothetical protein IPI35_07850 [Deltaproteobacteria bacterium]|nr:hypothetical protein [Deltaproteobacteria bacterium]